MRQAFVPKVLGTVFASVWVLGVISSAQADTDKSERCSVATLKGSYGYTVTGALVAGPSAGPFAQLEDWSLMAAALLKITGASVETARFYTTSRGRVPILSTRTVQTPSPSLMEASERGGDSKPIVEAVAVASTWTGGYNPSC